MKPFKYQAVEERDNVTPFPVGGARPDLKAVVASFCKTLEPGEYLIDALHKRIAPTAKKRGLNPAKRHIGEALRELEFEAKKRAGKVVYLIGTSRAQPPQLGNSTPPATEKKASPKYAPKAIDLADAELKFRDAAEKRGLKLPLKLESDGKIHRCGTDDDKHGDAGAYNLHLDGVPAGGFQNWKDGEPWENWRADIGRTLTEAERKAYAERSEKTRVAAEAEKVRRWKEAAKAAASIWNSAQAAPADHPYLKAKGIGAHGLRVHSDGRLIMPLRDEAGALHNLQFIAPDGEKRPVPGGRIKGCFHVLGKIETHGENLIGEGFSTMASCCDATSKPAVIGLNCGNLPAVAAALRKTYPHAKFIFCADHDAWTKGNPGERKASETVAEFGGRLAVPQFAGLRTIGQTDFNDLAQAEGLEAVRRCIDAAKSPQHPDDGQLHENEGFAPEYSEEWLALGFAEKHHHHLQYVSEQDAWMFWNGVHWEREKTLRAYNMIRAECRAACSNAKADGSDARIVFDLSKAKTRAAVETLARSDRRLASKSEDWDADDWLLGTPGGIIDLRTGKNIGFDPSKRITTITAVAPGGECPMWLKFLGQVTKGNKELETYLQRGAGYDLTGFATEQIIRFVYGEGGNGKGVFLRAVTKIMGKLHARANVESFIEKKYATHSTDIASLHRARAVSCQETRSGQVWDDAKLKDLSGGDVQKARFMRCDEFEFLPKFTLTIVGNHKPKFRAIDDGIRRRLHLIPFEFDVEQSGTRDNDLDEKLKAEWPGILRWMIDGCLEWQRIGLNPPECVLTATNEYLETEDMVGQWLEQNCIREPGARVKNSALFADWKGWADSAHVAVGDVRNLAAEIANRHGEGNRYIRDKVLAWKNLRLKTFEERCNDDAEDSREAKKGDGGGNSYIDRLGGNSSSALYAHTPAHTDGRSILGDPPLPPFTPLNRPTSQRKPHLQQRFFRRGQREAPTWRFSPATASTIEVG